MHKTLQTLAGKHAYRPDAHEFIVPMWHVSRTRCTSVYVFARKASEARKRAESLKGRDWQAREAIRVTDM